MRISKSQRPSSQTSDTTKLGNRILARYESANRATARVAHKFRWQHVGILLVLMLLIGLSTAGAVLRAAVCPFCSAVKQTLTEEMLTTDAVVFAKVLGPAKPAETSVDDLPTLDLMMNLEVTKVLKGKNLLTEGKTFTTVVPPSFQAGQECLVMGVITDRLSWSTPVKMTERSRSYILDLQELPEEGPQRLKFFLKYLEDPETLLAYDAYDEFARAPYADVKAIKGDMDRKQLLAWIQDSEVTINRKRLYYTMLGVCGTEEDLPLLEKLITSDDKRERAALDALSACYLTLAGEKGVALIEKQYLKNKDADYVDIYAAIAALRFHGTESDIIKVPRILEAMRLLLDRPDIADLVIPDLARWEDWSVMDKLVKMFKEADDDSKWVRVPIVNYLRSCPLPEAEKKIEELKEVDPQSVRRALLFFEVESGMDDSDDLDADFDKQLDELEKGGQSDKSKTDKSKTEGTGDGTNAAIDGSENGSGSPRVALRPVLSRDSVDADQALANDPDAQVISVSYVQPSGVESDPSSNALSTSDSLAGADETADQVDDVLTDGDEIEEGDAESQPSPATPLSSRETLPTSPSLPAEVRTASTNRNDQRTASVASSAANLSVSRTEDLPGSYTWLVVTLPVLANVILLVLAWSIFNGTFSRLFC